MVNSKLIIVLLSSLLAGCASLSETRKMNEFEETSKAFESAISWSDFETAALFLPPRESENLAATIEELKQFKVTSYKVKNFLPSKDKSQVLLIAEISYFKLNQLVVKKITYRQLWKYDTAERRWHITTGLPDFK
jgi:hypothetical protein